MPLHKPQQQCRDTSGTFTDDWRKQAIMARRNGGRAMKNVKNIAGNAVSLFLFRFVLRGNGIDFVLNEAIAADMYPDVEEKITPLVHACCETLLRYRHLS